MSQTTREHINAVKKARNEPLPYPDDKVEGEEEEKVEEVKETKSKGKK